MQRLCDVPPVRVVRVDASALYGTRLGKEMSVVFGILQFARCARPRPREEAVHPTHSVQGEQAAVERDGAQPGSCPGCGRLGGVG